MPVPVRQPTRRPLFVRRHPAPRPILLDRVPPELEAQFGSLMRASLLKTDQEARIASMDRKAFVE